MVEDDVGRAEVIAKVRAYEMGVTVPEVLSLHSNPTLWSMYERTYGWEIAGLTVILVLMTFCLLWWDLFLVVLAPSF